jgi:hypothetical protein
MTFPSTGGIVPVDGSSTTIHHGEWVSIFGSNLASGTATWNGNPGSQPRAIGLGSATVFTALLPEAAQAALTSGMMGVIVGMLALKVAYLFATFVLPFAFGARIVRGWPRLAAAGRFRWNEPEPENPKPAIRTQSQPSKPARQERPGHCPCDSGREFIDCCAIGHGPASQKAA